jgi:RNA polymerase sigma-70 factor (ECF subfamily)
LALEQPAPAWALGFPVSPEVAAARAALRAGFARLRAALQDVHSMALGATPMHLTCVHTDALDASGLARIRGRAHVTEAPSRKQSSFGKAGGGRATSPGRQTLPPDGLDVRGDSALTIQLPAPVPTTEPADGGGGFPSRPDPSDPAGEVWSLVERAQRGETEAFGQIYDRYVDTVFRFIYFRVGNRQLAEDLTADTFLRALKRIGSVTWQGRDLGAWLVTIARNLVADHFKSGRYRLEVTTGDVLDADREDRGPEGSPESAVVDHITNVTLLSAVKHLNPEQQECIVLRFLQGFSVAETAQAMNKNEGAIKALQYRAVRALHRLLPEGFH